MEEGLVFSYCLQSQDEIDLHEDTSLYDGMVAAFGQMGLAAPEQQRDE